jgi:molybdopterin synthase sulfur carrier subunit
MMTAHIQLKLFATLNKLLPDTAENHPIQPGISVHDLIKQLEIPPKEAKLIFINGVKSDFSATLKDGDRVGIFPPVGGG